MVVRGSDEALSIGVTASAEAPGASGPDWGRSSGDKGGIEAGLGREPGPGGDLTPSTLPAVLQLIPEQAVSQFGGESVVPEPSTVSRGTSEEVCASDRESWDASLGGEDAPSTLPALLQLTSEQAVSQFGGEGVVPVYRNLRP